MDMVIHVNRDPLLFFCSACSRDIAVRLNKKDYKALCQTNKQIRSVLLQDGLLHCMLLQSHYNITTVGPRDAVRWYYYLGSPQFLQFESDYNWYVNTTTTTQLQLHDHNYNNNYKTTTTTTTARPQQLRQLQQHQQQATTETTTNNKQQL